MFPPSFRTQNIKTDGAVIHVRVGGSGPAVLMLHGFGDTGDMWAPLAARLVEDHTVVVPDLRGMGRSSHPEGGYEKKTQARDVARVVDKLKIDKADLVTHDIGNMVGYAFAAQYADRVPAGSSWMPLFRVSAPGTKSSEAPRCGISISADPDIERLVKGRERIYLDRFLNELSANPKSIDEATRRHYAKLYARPGAMHSAFNQ